MATVSPRIDKKTGKQYRHKLNPALTCWRAGYTRVDPATGKLTRASATIYAPTRRDAQREANRLELESRVASSTLTLAQYYTLWIAELRESLAPNTTIGYDRIYKRYILPELGDYPLTALTPNKINVFVQHLKARKLERNPTRTISGETCVKIFRSLGTLLQHAVYHERIDSNPARAVKTPQRTKTHKVEYYHVDEIPAFWHALQGELLLWRVVYAIALLTGVRRGELVGLRWSDYDVSRATITIQRAATRIPGKKNSQHCKTPKTPESIRPAIVPAELADILREWREVQRGDDGDYILSYRDEGEVAGECVGTTLTWVKLDLVTKYITYIAARHNLRPVSLHGLRHTYATMQLAAGTPIHEVQASLGHSTPTTTINIYGHISGDRSVRLQTVITAALTGELKGNLEEEIATKTDAPASESHHMG